MTTIEKISLCFLCTTWPITFYGVHAPEVRVHWEFQLTMSNEQKNAPKNGGVLSSFLL